MITYSEVILWALTAGAAGIIVASAGGIALLIFRSFAERPTPDTEESEEHED